MSKQLGAGDSAHIRLPACVHRRRPAACRRGRSTPPVRARDLIFRQRKTEEGDRKRRPRANARRLPPFERRRVFARAKEIEDAVLRVHDVYFG